MATTKWALDASHSEVLFKVKHMMITNVTGKFGTYSADVETEGDDFTTAKIKFTINTASVNSNDDNRDGHLKGADFFDVEKYPDMTFESTAYNAKGGEDFELIGDLTIKDVTKQITLSGEFGGIGKDPWGNTKAGFTLNGKIHREDFGLNWNAALEAGGVLVSKDVRISCDIQLAKQ